MIYVGRREIIDFVGQVKWWIRKNPCCLKTIHTHNFVYLVIKIDLKRHFILLCLVILLILYIVNKLDSFNILQDSLEIANILNSD